MLKALYCPCCGKPMETYLQQDYRIRTSIEYFTVGTCREEGCILLHQTISSYRLEGDLTKYGVVKVRYNVLTGLEKRS
jgi:RNase P subunit RPR2